MRTFTYSKWSGRDHTVEAEHVTFEPSGHVAFWTGDGDFRVLVLAERTENVNGLREVADEPEPLIGSE